MKHSVDSQGFYGQFGGAYIPELLNYNIEALKKNYLKIISSSKFQKEFNTLLEEYVGRPTPLTHAKNLSAKYKTNIFLKREDLCHTGSHKINNTIGQILLAQQLGKKNIIAETGAGQHGVATATVCALMKMNCKVFMGAIDIERQALNVVRMKMLGTEVVEATSGSKTLKDATNEAIRYWINNPDDTHYIIGSVVGPHPYPNMVSRFQSVISKEIQTQLFKKFKNKNPDYIIACVGGGSNAAGGFYHYLDNPKVKLIGVEAAGKGINSGHTAATLCKGSIGIIHASKTLLLQNKDGQIIEPYSISAGLDYPGIGPLHAHLYTSKRATYFNATDNEALEAAHELSLSEGIIPAIETAHALSSLKKIKFKKSDIIVLILSGRGDKDMNTYVKALKF